MFIEQVHQKPFQLRRSGPRGGVAPTGLSHLYSAIASINMARRRR